MAQESEQSELTEHINHVDQSAVHHEYFMNVPDMQAASESSSVAVTTVDREESTAM